MKRKNKRPKPAASDAAAKDDKTPRRETPSRKKKDRRVAAFAERKRRINVKRILILLGILIVLGGTGAAMLINCPLRNLISAFSHLLKFMRPSSGPTPEEVIDEMVRLAQTAQAGGGSGKSYSSEDAEAITDFTQQI